MDYDYIKNHYRLIVIDLSRQKELDADPKAIQQVEFVGQLKKLDANDSPADTASNDQSMFVLTILEKIKEMWIKVSQGTVTVLWQMANNLKLRVNLPNIQLNKLKCTANVKSNTNNNYEKLWRWRIVTWVIFNNKTSNKNKKCLC